MAHPQCCHDKPNLQMFFQDYNFAFVELCPLWKVKLSQHHPNTSISSHFLQTQCFCGEVVAFSFECIVTLASAVPILIDSPGLQMRIFRDMRHMLSCWPVKSGIFFISKPLFFVEADLRGFPFSPGNIFRQTQNCSSGEIEKV
jgi:hypothetical protein